MCFSSPYFLKGRGDTTISMPIYTRKLVTSPSFSFFFFFFIICFAEAAASLWNSRKRSLFSPWCSRRGSACPPKWWQSSLSGKDGPQWIATTLFCFGGTRQYPSWLMPAVLLPLVNREVQTWVLMTAMHGSGFQIFLLGAQGWVQFLF